MQIFTSVSFIFVQRVDGGKKAQQKHDLSTFTCCLWHILKGTMSTEQSVPRIPVQRRRAAGQFSGHMCQYVPFCLYSAVVLDSILIQLYFSLSLLTFPTVYRDAGWGNLVEAQLFIKNLTLVCMSRTATMPIFPSFQCTGSLIDFQRTDWRQINDRAVFNRNC